MVSPLRPHPPRFKSISLSVRGSLGSAVGLGEDHRDSARGWHFPGAEGRGDESPQEKSESRMPVLGAIPAPDGLERGVNLNFHMVTHTAHKRGAVNPVHSPVSQKSIQDILCPSPGAQESPGSPFSPGRDFSASSPSPSHQRLPVDGSPPQPSHLT